MGKYATAGLLLLLAAMAFSGCQKKTASETVPSKTVPAETASLETIPAPGFAETVPGDVSEDGQLMASAENLEEAQKLAELYGIELVDYGYRVALFRTDEDPRAVIQRGKENGWPELSLNHTAKAF